MRRTASVLVTRSYGCFEEKEMMKIAMCMSLPERNTVLRSRLSSAASRVGLLLLAALSVIGCSSGSSLKPQVGTISFTDVNGTPLTTPPTTLTVGQGAYVEANLTNDTQLLGADWSVVCGSAPAPGTPLPPGQVQDQSCGTFTPAHTIGGPIPTYVSNGGGYVALYTAPAVPPKQGVVTLYASATSDHSRYSTVTLSIGGNPISVGFAPAPPSTMQVGATAQFKAALNNDFTNAGVNWTVICGSSDCGSFNPTHTIGGVNTTYTAPATLPTGGTVKVTATSVADPTKAVSATITITTVGTGTATGSVQAAQQGVSGAEVSLYAARTSEIAFNSAAGSDNVPSLDTVFTDQDGNFTLPYGYECPTPDTQMYLVSTGGNAGGGVNPNLTLISALGPCATMDASRVVVNETTTVAAVYALSNFMSDPLHVGSRDAAPSGMQSAFLTAKDLVDITTGLARTSTISGRGVVPQAKINTLANLLSACAKTAGSAPGDGSACDELFRATNPGGSAATQASDTAQALLDLVRNAKGFSNHSESFAALYQLAASSDSLGRTLASEPSDWTVAIRFPNGQESPNIVAAKALSSDNADPSVDSAGNVWVRGNGKAATEFVGAASCAGAPKALLPIAANSGSAP